MCNIRKQTCKSFQCTIDESIKGAASLRRYGITFDGNIDKKYKTPPHFYLRFSTKGISSSKQNMLSYLESNGHDNYDIWVPM